jgi:hypothetical protein
LLASGASLNRKIRGMIHGRHGNQPYLSHSSDVPTSRGFSVSPVIIPQIEVILA